MKNCKNCGHREGYTCLLSGYFYMTERKISSKCGMNFEGWTEKPKNDTSLSEMGKAVLLFLLVWLIAYLIFG